jgi:hypothetical protein
MRRVWTRTEFPEKDEKLSEAGEYQFISGEYLFDMLFWDDRVSVFEQNKKSRGLNSLR